MSFALKKYIFYADLRIILTIITHFGIVTCYIF